MNPLCKYKKNGSLIAASVFFVVCSLDNYMPMHEVAPSAVSIADIPPSSFVMSTRANA